MPIWSVPNGAPCRDVSDAALGSVVALGIRRRHAPRYIKALGPAKSHVDADQQSHDDVVEQSVVHGATRAARTAAGDGRSRAAVRVGVDRDNGVGKRLK